MQHKYSNNLVSETSPYLRQHAHNPVNWHPWGEVALQKAREENKVIIVSIGYSACHWCHVMEKESFEDEATATVMNENFINIKIDREERPDLDHIYMDAVQAMTGSGGWPLNVFLTPDARPFYGGTYFPPAKAFNRPSWVEVLHGVANAWATQKNEIQAQAENMMAHLRQSNGLAQTKFKPSPVTENFFTAEDCETVFSNIMKTADTEWGGFGRAPKFPQTFTIQYLLQYHHFTGNKTALQQGLLSIDKMLQGGIYDHVSGGMARYSTDTEWLAPHFEKMLYDNALLIDVCCDAYQITKEEKYAAAIDKTIGFIRQELMDGRGAFYAALDADSEGEEGKYYVWQKAEIENILGADAVIFCDFFDVSEKGNWEGKNILRVLQPANEFVKEKGIDETAFQNLIGNCLQKLQAIRNKRIKPSLDDKIILGWNTLLIKSSARAALVLQNENYRQLAVTSFNFIQQNFRLGNESFELLHTWKEGIAKYPAFLDDYAYLIAACIGLYETTFENDYLHAARQFCSYVEEHFGDEENIFFFYTNDEQKDVIVRKKEIYDGAVPAGNSVMADNLLKLSLIFNRADWKERAEKMLRLISPLAIKYPGSFGIWNSILLQQVVGINEIAVVGEGSHELAVNISLINYIPNKILMASIKSTVEFPLLAAKPDTGPAMAFLCRNYACQAPVTTAESLMEQISKRDKIYEPKHNN